jgi:hypothetical protein
MKKLMIGLFLLPFIGSMAQINPTNNRIVMDVSTFPQNNTVYNYDSCFAVGKNLGMTQTGISQNWTAVETAPNVYNFNIFNIANIYYPAHNMALDLTLTPIHTNVLEVPSDLVSTAFSSTVMINRFKKLLDSVKAHIPNVTLSSLVIGSEHDIYLGSNSSAWANYTTFYNSVAAHAKTLWPGLKVATELTFDGLTQQNTLAQAMNANSDYIGVSYYPINSNFTVKPVSTIPNDFATLVSLYPSKKLCFYQFGYPTSSTCNSSNNLQKQFITQAFTSWDNYANNIYMIDFTWIHDLDPVQVAFYSSYYGVSNPAFLEFLRTLGLRTFTGNGADKPALDELRCQAKQRGFNNLNIACSTTSVLEQTFRNENSVFPNPFKTHIEIANADLENGYYQIVNHLGSLVKSGELHLNIKIEADELDAGIYLIRLYNAQHVLMTTNKIVKTE